jgi:hypothetical protein
MRPNKIQGRPKGDVRVGAVITFKPHVTAEQAQKVLEAMNIAGYIETSTANEFDDYYGGPVWYIP